MNNTNQIIEKEIPVQAFQLHAYCPKCKDAELVCEHGIATSFGTDHLHECPKCHEEYWLCKAYPIIQYREIKNAR